MASQKREQDRRLKRRRRNAAEVAKYLEFRDPITMKGTAGSSFNLEVVHQSNPESEAPMSDRGHNWHSDVEKDNQDFYKKMNPIIQKYWGTDKAIPARLLENDPTRIRAWRAGVTEHHRKLLRDFETFCLFLAKKLEDAWGEVIIHCHIHPKLQEVSTGREAQKIDTAYSDGVIVRKLEKIEREEGPMLRRAAIGLLSDREDYSPRRIRSAIEGVNRRLKEEAS